MSKYILGMICIFVTFTQAMNEPFEKKDVIRVPKNPESLFVIAQRVFMDNWFTYSKDKKFNWLFEGSVDQRAELLKIKLNSYITLLLIAGQNPQLVSGSVDPEIFFKKLEKDPLQKGKYLISQQEGNANAYLLLQRNKQVRQSFDRILLKLSNCKGDLSNLYMRFRDEFAEDPVIRAMLKRIDLDAKKLPVDALLGVQIIADELKNLKRILPGNFGPDFYTKNTRPLKLHFENLKKDILVPGQKNKVCCYFENLEKDILLPEKRTELLTFLKSLE